MESRLLHSLFFASLLSLIACSSFAKFSLGGEIRYEQLDSMKYRIFVTQYYDCNTIQGQPPVLFLQCINSSGAKVGSQATLSGTKLTSSVDITPICATAKSGCQGEPYSFGVQARTFSVDLNLDSNAYKSFASCHKIRIEAGSCCRNGNISTGAANSNFYTFVEFTPINGNAARKFHKKTNSAPNYLTDPLFLLKCNVPVYKNFRGMDSLDGDSLSYSLAQPLSGYNQNISYSGTYLAYDHPFSVFYPGGTKPPFALPFPKTKLPPNGFYFNSRDGNMIFTPTKCVERTVFVVEIDEWRKDTSGTYHHIGKTRRDMLVRVEKYYGTSYPTIAFQKAPSVAVICEGEQTCFEYQTIKNDINTATGQTNAKDSIVQFAIHTDMTGATFRLKDSTAKYPTGIFCWTPPVNSASAKPYNLLLSIKDNICPNPNKYEINLQFVVKKPYTANRIYKKLTCGVYEIQVDSSLQKDLTHQKTIKRKSGKATNSYFASTNQGLSTRREDIIYFTEIDTFIITSIILAPNSCEKPSFDTVIVENNLENSLVNFSYQPQACNDYIFETTIDSNFQNLKGKFEWLILDSKGKILPKQMSEYLFTSSDSSTSMASHDTLRLVKDDFYPLQLRLANEACSLTIDTFIQHQENIGLKLNTMDTTLCAGSKIQFYAVAQKSGTTFEWLKDNSTNILLKGDTILYDSEENFKQLRVQATSPRKCTDEQSIRLKMHPNKKSSNLQLYERCLGDTVRLKYNPMDYKTVTYSGDTNKFNFEIWKNDSYIVEYKDNNNCTYTDSIQAKFYAAPVKELRDVIYCGEKVFLNISNYPNIFWNDGSKSKSLLVTSSGTYIVKKGYTNCEMFDTAKVVLKTVPNFTLGKDTALCADSLLLTGAPTYKYEWSNGSKANFITVKSSGIYSVIVTGTNACTVKDTIRVTLNKNIEKITLSKSNDTLFSNKKGTHLWFKDGIKVANNAAYHPMKGTGNYSASFIDSNGCISDTSSFYFTSSILAIYAAQVQVYPNPNKGRFILDIGSISLNDISKIEVMTSNGKLIKRIETVQKNQEITIDGASGMYFLMIHTPLGVLKKELSVVR